MKFDILNKFTGKVIFTADIDECAEDELPSIQLGLAVKCAVENHANLSYANLSSANLSYANLRSADLYSADLRSADLNHADLHSANLRYADLSYADLSYADLVVILLPIWTVYVQSTYTRIGCKHFKNSEWLSFADEEIAGMDNKALEWWNKYKPIIEAAIKSLN